MIDWAGACAAAGFRVIAQRAKRPLLQAWPGRATADETTLREWWAKRPYADIGLVTGERADVFDIEGPCLDAVLFTGRGSQDARRGDALRGRHVYVASLGLGNRRLLLDQAPGHGRRLGASEGDRGRRLVAVATLRHQRTLLLQAATPPPGPKDLRPLPG